VPFEHPTIAYTMNTPPKQFRTMRNNC